MTQEQLRMQFLSGIITEDQYKAKLIKNITYQGGTEDMPHRKDIIVNNNEPYLTSETTKDEQQKIANDLKVNVTINQMYEPNKFAEILGYNSVKDLAKAIAKKHGVELTLDLEEDQYKEKLEENSDKMKYLEDALRNVWNMGKDNNPIDFNKLAKSIDDDMFTILNNALEKYTSEMDDSEVY
jgi:hypothetical protein